MEFTTLPPEVISALIHSGPGAESLIAASAAWQQLGANLEDSADNYAASLSSMDETWHGPSSAAMLQAVQPYVTWLRTTAQQAQQTAASAQAAAAAFNSVQRAVVPTADGRGQQDAAGTAVGHQWIWEESSGHRRNRI